MEDDAAPAAEAAAAAAELVFPEVVARALALGAPEGIRPDFAKYFVACSGKPELELTEHGWSFKGSTNWEKFGVLFQPKVTTKNGEDIFSLRCRLRRVDSEQECGAELRVSYMDHGTMKCKMAPALSHLERAHKGVMLMGIGASSTGGAAAVPTAGGKRRGCIDTLDELNVTSKAYQLSALKMLLLDGQPLTACERPGFRSFLDLLNLPRIYHTTLEPLLDSKFAEFCKPRDEHIKEYLGEAAFTVVCDGTTYVALRRTSSRRPRSARRRRARSATTRTWPISAGAAAPSPRRPPRAALRARWGRSSSSSARSAMSSTSCTSRTRTPSSGPTLSATPPRSKARPRATPSGPQRRRTGRFSSSAPRCSWRAASWRRPSTSACTPPRTASTTASARG